MPSQPQRVWARTPPDEFGNQQWVMVTPDPQTGLLDMLYFAALAQCLRLNLNESPFYANYGIPAYQSVATQVPPDYYIARIQSQYAQYFASLVISRAPTPISPPTYNARAVCHSGLILNASIPAAT